MECLHQSRHANPSRPLLANSACSTPYYHEGHPWLGKPSHFGAGTHATLKDSPWQEISSEVRQLQPWAEAQQLSKAQWTNFSSFSARIALAGVYPRVISAAATLRHVLEGDDRQSGGSRSKYLLQRFDCYMLVRIFTRSRLRRQKMRHMWGLRCGKGRMQSAESGAAFGRGLTG